PRNVFFGKSTKHHPWCVTSAHSHDETAAGGDGVARLRGDHCGSFPGYCIRVGKHFNSHFSSLRVASTHMSQYEGWMENTKLRLCFFREGLRASPSPSGRGWREAPGEGGQAECAPALIRPFGPPSPGGEKDYSQ